MTRIMDRFLFYEIFEHNEERKNLEYILCNKDRRTQTLAVRCQRVRKLKIKYF